MEVGESVDGRTAPADGGIDTTSWFESQLPSAAEQPEAKIELTSITDSTPLVPTPPPLSEITPELPQNGEHRPE